MKCGVNDSAGFCCGVSFLSEYRDTGMVMGHELLEQHEAFVGPFCEIGDA